MLWQIFTRGPKVLYLFTPDDDGAAVICASFSFSLLQAAFSSISMVLLAQFVHFLYTRKLKAKNKNTR